MTTFRGWIHAVDTAVQETAGCSVHDLPDCTFYDWYEDGMPPSEAAQLALEEAGYFAFLRVWEARA